MHHAMTDISPVMQTVASYIVQAADKPLPDAVTEATKHHLLDTLAAMVSGSRLPSGETALAYVKAQGGTKEASVPGSRIVTTVINAALAGGMLAHADETDDSHAPSLTHPGCAIVPAALAMAEREYAAGTALLRAVALGYDISSRMSPALGGYAVASAGRDTHALGTLFGAAAACASLARLNEAQVRHMLSYASQQASGLSNYARDTEKTTVRVSQQGARTVNNRSMPDINMQYMIAVMLIDRTATLEAAHDIERMNDPQVLEMRSRVELLGDDVLQAALPIRQGIVEVTLKNGRVLHHHTRHVRGTPQNPMTREEVEEKCYRLLRPVFRRKRAKALIEAAWNLEEVGNVQALRPLLKA